MGLWQEKRSCHSLIRLLKGWMILKISSSIRTQIHAVLVLSAALCISVVLLSSTSTQEAIRGTRTFFDCNSALSNFYVTVDKMDSFAREWVYSREQMDYENYRGQAALAWKELETIRSLGDSQLAWRLGRLENMLNYYQQPIEQLLAGETAVYETYNMLSYRCVLIRNTATTYYTYLADYLQESADAVQARWEKKWIAQMAALTLLVAVGMFISSSYSKGILRPIQTMTQNARKVQHGDFHLQPVEKAPAELAVMADAFAEMAGQVEQNIDVLKKNAQLEQILLRQESERLSMQNLVTQAELRSLQAQINPHFLFNTLSMISKSAYLSHDAITSELIDRLAQFLRYALDKSSTTSTLQEEINSIENYLFIQKKRFAGRLDFVVDVPQEIPRLKMPAIVLQPLVENAIKHGVDPLTEEAVISLKVRTTDHRVRIQIEDNGIGMSAQQLENLQSYLKLGLDSSSGGKDGGIGLTNVYRRLKVYFGGDFLFNIESEENCGTLITISLPMEEEE